MKCFSKTLHDIWRGIISYCFVLILSGCFVGNYYRAEAEADGGEYKYKIVIKGMRRAMHFGGRYETECQISTDSLSGQIDVHELYVRSGSSLKPRRLTLKDRQSQKDALNEEGFIKINGTSLIVSIWSTRPVGSSGEDIYPPFPSDCNGQYYLNKSAL